MFEKFGINEKNAQQQIQEIKNVPLTLDNSVAIFPYTLLTGFVDLTDSGERSGRNGIETFSQLERVWTGNATATAEWDNSVELIATADGSKVEKKYKPGDHFLGQTYQAGTANNFGEAAFGSYKNQTELKGITVFVPASQIVLVDEYTKKVFKMPQLTSKWLRISSYETMYDLNQEPAGYNINFITQDATLGTTGKAIYNPIQQGALGEGYAEPLIETIKDKRVIKVDQEKLISLGVDSVQIELMGNAGLCGMIVYGREVDDKYITKPKWIFINNALTPKESAVKKTSAISNSLSLVRDCKPTLATYYKNWKEDMQQNYDWSIRKQFEGVLKTDYTNTKADGYANKIPWQGGNTADFTTPAEVNFIGSAFTSATGKYNVSITRPNTKISELLSLQGLSAISIPQLPMEITERIPWRINEIPIVGKILNFLTLGTIGWANANQNDLYIKNGFTMLMSKPQYLFATEGVFAVNESGTNPGLIPFEMFDNSVSSPIGDISATKATNLSLRFSLSDEYVNFNGDDKNTDILGSDVLGSVGDKFEIKDTNKKFIVDKIMPVIFGKCEYIISAYRGESRIFTGLFESQSKFSGNMRDWVNTISTTHWHKDSVQGDLSWKGMLWADYKPPKQYIIPLSNETFILSPQGPNGLRTDLREFKFQIATNLFPQITSVTADSVQNNHVNGQWFNLKLSDTGLTSQAWGVETYRYKIELQGSTWVITVQIQLKSTGRQYGNYALSFGEHGNFSLPDIVLN